MEKKLKHLEMIQGVINRMAHCSFLLKGWSVVLVSGLFALAAKESKLNLIYLAYLPVIFFWILDGFYLYQERLYRKLYGFVRKLEPDEIDFDMNANRFSGQNKASWYQSMMSKTMFLFHGIILVTVIIVMVLSIYLNGEANG